VVEASISARSAVCVTFSRSCKHTLTVCIERDVTPTPKGPWKRLLEECD
jgi:hypothetical protein